jgi:chromosome segregation ATPase
MVRVSRPEGGNEMRVSKVKEVLQMGGSIVSYINCLGIILGIIIGATWYLKDRENKDTNQSTEIAAVVLQVKQSAESTNAQIADLKKTQAEKTDQVNADLSAKLTDAKAQLTAVSTQVQTMQNTNIALSGRVDLVDQKVTQAGIQLDRLERNQPGWEKRLADVETGLSVIKALFEQEKPRK